jgi:hypothetical protein
MHVFLSTEGSKLGNRGIQGIQGMRQNAAPLNHNRFYESSKKRKVTFIFV